MDRFCIKEQLVIRVLVLNVCKIDQPIEAIQGSVSTFETGMRSWVSGIRYSTLTTASTLKVFSQTRPGLAFFDGLRGHR